MITSIKNIVFTGGGLKGWAYIGTIRALDEYLDRTFVEHVIGVSVGSLFGLCYVLGIQWDTLLDFVMGLNFKELCDIDIDSILINKSLLHGIKFMSILKDFVSMKVDPDITFNQLKRYSKIKYTVNALNLTKKKLEYFNYELTPDVKVVDAIRASCGIPLVFPMWNINGNYYVDGGICNNCPINLADEVDTIAFDVSHDNTVSSEASIVDCILSIIEISNGYEFNRSSENIYKILDPMFKDEFLHLNQTRDDIFTIYMHGYTNSKNLLFTNHIALK
jgi:predicted acylesterase/phospholipase RssA